MNKKSEQSIKDILGLEFPENESKALLEEIKKILKEETTTVNGFAVYSAKELTDSYKQGYTTGYGCGFSDGVERHKDLVKQDIGTIEEILKEHGTISCKNGDCNND